MSDYAIFFDYNNKTYRLPVNPEQIETRKVQANEKYEVLKLGQIVVPTHMELTEFTFDTEFPKEAYHYVETPGGFKDPDYYLNRFDKWMASNEPIRFIASNGIGDDINTLVLIEDLIITERAGEESDKYVKFKLVEYREYGKKKAEVAIKSMSSGKKKKATATKEVNPNSSGYHTVQSGESLWSIAKTHYGDGAKCNIIFNANKEKIKNPSVLSVGWKLKIPAKDEFSKYSAALPKTITKEPALPAFQGGVSDAGRTHSSGGRKL